MKKATMNGETTDCEGREGKDSPGIGKAATQFANLVTQRSMGKQGYAIAIAFPCVSLYAFSGTLGIRHLLTSFRQWRAATMTQKTQRKNGRKTHEDLSKSSVQEKGRNQRSPSLSLYLSPFLFSLSLWPMQHVSELGVI